jgi:hypothetical protein
MRRWPALIAALAITTHAATAEDRGAPIPESIVADGVPAIPRDLARALDRYRNVRSASFQDWLGGTRQVMITTRFAVTNQVHRVAAPGAARFQLTFLPERVLAASARPGHSTYLYATDEGGAENYQLFLADPKPGQARRVSDGRARHTGPRWSNSGGLLAYSSNARNGTDMDLCVIDPDRPESARRLKEVSGDWHVSDWSPDDRRVRVPAPGSLRPRGEEGPPLDG